MSELELLQEISTQLSLITILLLIDLFFPWVRRIKDKFLGVRKNV